MTDDTCIHSFALNKDNCIYQNLISRRFKKTFWEDAGFGVIRNAYAPLSLLFC